MTAERDFIENFPSELQKKLLLCYQNLGRLDLYEPDAMHNVAHVSQVERNANWIADDLDLKPKQRALLSQAIALHDEGYKFVEMGILTPDEHNIGSALIALHKTGNIRLAKGILLHSNDVLPRNTPDWVRILRDADRVERLGWTGVIFIAFYLGFRHELVNGPLSYQQTLSGEKQVNDQLRDPRHPYNDVEFWVKPSMCFHVPPEFEWTWTDYEQKAADFTREHIFPFLLERNLIGRLTDNIHKEIDTWQKRVEGVETEDSEWDKIKWEIEPVHPIVYAMFSAKRFNSEQAARELSAYRYLREEDLQKLEKWKNPKPFTPIQESQERLRLKLRHIVSADNKNFWGEFEKLPKDPNIDHEIVVYFGKEYISEDD